MPIRQATNHKKIITQAILAVFKLAGVTAFLNFKTNAPNIAQPPPVYTRTFNIGIRSRPHLPSKNINRRPTGQKQPVSSASRLRVESPALHAPPNMVHSAEILIKPLDTPIRAKLSVAEIFNTGHQENGSDVLAAF